MGEIKSAFEKAMEKAEGLSKPSEEDMRKWKYVPEGERLAARYLRDECNLVTELKNCDDLAKPYVIEGAQDVLLRNIGLPKNDHAKKVNKKVMQALRALKRDTARLENVYSKLRRIFNHYEQTGEQQRKEAYQNLLREFEARIQQATQQQLGMPVRVRVDVEKHPLFHEEWRKVLSQLDSQYLLLLDECKREIMSLS